MKIQLIGVRFVNYTNKTGREVSGINVYGIDVSTEFSDLLGHTVFDEFISGHDGSDLELGEVYSVEFENYKFNGRYQSRVVGLRKES